MRACMSASKPKIEASGAKAAMTQPPLTICLVNGMPCSLPLFLHFILVLAICYKAVAMIVVCVISEIEGNIEKFTLVG